MIKKLSKFILGLIIVMIIIVSYLSFFGIKTERLNNKIKNEILKLNEEINLELKNVNFLLNPIDLSINVKTFEPVVIINKNELKLDTITTNISLKSFINKQFSIDDLKVSTKEIRLNDLTLLVRSFKNSPELFFLDKFIKDGFLVGDINLNFDEDGIVKKDYEIKGFIKKGKFDIFKKYLVNDLNLVFNIKNKRYSLKEIDATFNEIKFSSSLIQIQEKKDKFLVDGSVVTDEKDASFHTLNTLFKNIFKDQGIKDINLSSTNNFTFDISKKFKVNNFNLESKVDLNNLLYKKKLNNLNKFLPNFKENLKLEDHKIFIKYKKNQLNIKGKGQISIEDKIDYFNYEINKKNNNYNFKTAFDIRNNSISLDALSYNKEKDLNSKLILEGSFDKDKEIKFDNISLIDEKKNSFKIENLILDNKFKIININKLDLNFSNINKIDNKIYLKRSKKNYKIYGKSFDASKLIDEILHGDSNEKKSSSIFKNLNSKIDLNIEKIYIDNDTYVSNLDGKIIYINNQVTQLNLNSFFPNKKKLTLTINTNKNNEKITTLYSDYPKPLIKQYKFVKGFEEGVLDFSSIKKDDVTSSLLIIDNFKVQEVPVLAKLLTLASLQGIADLLTGEGIRFTDLEMKFTNKKGLMTIEEMYAIGPAISILMEGYIESKKLISLRGTLVPATTINRSIASIPLIGNILVGKKTGEGVFGVSFKVKGPPKDLKTTVNPVKTLTPRFITRTLEKIKKN
jgi:hypothetical protein